MYSCSSSQTFRGHYRTPIISKSNRYLLLKWSVYHPETVFRSLTRLRRTSRYPQLFKTSSNPLLNKSLREFLRPNPTVEAVIRHLRRQPQLKRLNPSPSTPLIRPERPPIDRKSNSVITCRNQNRPKQNRVVFRGFRGLKQRIGTEKSKNAAERPRESGSALDPQHFRGRTLPSHESGAKPPQRALLRSPQIELKLFIQIPLHPFTSEALAEPIQTHTGRSRRGQNSRVVSERIDMEFGLVKSGVQGQTCGIGNLVVQ